MFHSAGFEKIKYAHHTIGTYSGFKWSIVLSPEKADSITRHLLEVTAIMGIPVQIKTENAPTHVSSQVEHFSRHNEAHCSCTTYSTRQAVVERSNCTLQTCQTNKMGSQRLPEIDYIMLYCLYIFKC